jgi:hypothetical protein
MGVRSLPNAQQLKEFFIAAQRLIDLCHQKKRQSGSLNAGERDNFFAAQRIHISCLSASHSFSLCSLRQTS